MLRVQIYLAHNGGAMTMPTGLTVDHLTVADFSRSIGIILATHRGGVPDIRVRQLHLEWAIDHWAAIEMESYVEVFDYCYERLTHKWFWYGDMDGYARRTTWKEEGVVAFIHVDQNVNLLFAKQKAKVYKDALEKLTMSDWPPEFYIYEYWKKPSHKWPKRQSSLKELVDNQGSKYKDSRDDAWIANLPFKRGLATDGMIGTYHRFTHALFCLELLAGGLGEAHDV